VVLVGVCVCVCARACVGVGGWVRGRSCLGGVHVLERGVVLVDDAVGNAALEDKSVLLLSKYFSNSITSVRMQSYMSSQEYMLLESSQKRNSSDRAGVSDGLCYLRFQTTCATYGDVGR